MIVRLLTEHHLEFLSLKEGCRGSTECTHVRMPHCWKSHALAQIYIVHSTLHIFDFFFIYFTFENIKNMLFLHCKNITCFHG